MARGVFSLAVVACVLLLVGSSLQLGTLWVNQIWGNSDTRYVNIEDVRIDDNSVFVDFVNQLGSNGVTVEQTNLKAGSVKIPVNLNVDQTGTVSGAMYANGGIFADDGAGGQSFTVEDNTGVTTIAGQLRPNGGINVDGGRFTVLPSGETTIDTAVLRPNGGIDSNFGQFTVDPSDGSVLTKGQMTVSNDIVLGTNTEEDRAVRRVPAASRNGGNTIIKGQDGIVTGGNLELLPGYANIGTNHGQIVLGRAAADDLYVTRSDVATSGGKTILTGQTSTAARGGDLIVRAGSSTGVNTAGGNLVLVPGRSATSSSNGDIILGGTNDDSLPEFDLTVRRPDTTTLNAGSTTFMGQTASAGNGGDIVIAGGNGKDAGTVGPLGSFGGDVVLLPGVAANTYGKIVLGRNDNDELYVTRVASVGNAGATYFKGQDSGLGNGGDMRIIAGDAAIDPAAASTMTPAQSGGDIHLMTGLSTNGATPGSIYWGNEKQALEIRRETANDAANVIGTSTSIYGQNSAAATGGSLTLQSGTGKTGSGNIMIQVPALTGNAATTRSGTISVLAGDSVGVKGGDIQIAAGNGVETSGGVVSIMAGSTTGAGAGGNVILQAGSGASTATSGKVVVKSGAQMFLVDQAPVYIDNGELYLTRTNPADANNPFTVKLSADPNAILTVNGNVILKQRITQTIAAVTTNPITLAGPLPSNSIDQYLQDMQKSLNAIIRALSPCGHGLFDVYDPQSKQVVTSTSNFCTTNVRRRNLAFSTVDGIDLLSATQRSEIRCGKNSADLTVAPAKVTAQTNVRGDNLATSADTQPPLAYLLNDPNKVKCLMYSDAVSGPVATGDTIAPTSSFGVMAAGYIHDQPTEPTKI
jgi:hypothetical protein